MAHGLVVALAVLGALGCAADEGPPRYFELRLEGVEAVSVSGAAVDAEVITEAAARAIAVARTFVDPARRSAPVVRGRLAVADLVDADGGHVLRVELEGEIPPEAVPRLGPALEATVELTHGDGRLEGDRDVADAVGRAVAAFDARVLLGVGTVHDVAGLLADPDPQIVQLALDHVARQRLRELADPVAALVDHRDPTTAAAAVECLGVVGGAEHSTLLVRRARLGDRATAQRLYEALGRLGGDEAIGFLEFAARNEDDPVLANVAASALRDAQAPRPPDARPNAGLRGHRP